MKTPQRKFVVEFKSPRRQKARTNSIWGDTDLKALALEVEAQSSDLNYSGKAENVLSDITVVLPQVEMGPAHETADIVDAVSTVPADDLKTDALPCLNSGHPDVEPALAAQEPLNKPEPVTASKRARNIRNGRKPRSASEHAVQPAQAAIYVEPSPDIAALDAENKRLKQLLVEHLRDQNLQLRQMLERFDLS